MAPIKNRYTPYKRKEPTEPSKAVSGKPLPVKGTIASSHVSTTTTTTTTTTSSSRETKTSNPRNEKRPPLSPSRLKDQAEIHAKLQQAVKEQQVKARDNGVLGNSYIMFLRPTQMIKNFPNKIWMGSFYSI